MARVREDVHIHAPAAEVFPRLARVERASEWLPPSFRDARLERDGGGTRPVLAFRFAMPMRASEARLVVDEEEEPAYLALRAHANGSSNGQPVFERLEWALHQESPRNVHVTLECSYTPSGGLLGPLLEMAVHAPLRRQALRDALWRLKLVSEGQVLAPDPLA